MNLILYFAACNNLTDNAAWWLKGAEGAPIYEWEAKMKPLVYWLLVQKTIFICWREKIDDVLFWRGERIQHHSHAQAVDTVLGHPRGCRISAVNHNSSVLQNKQDNCDNKIRFVSGLVPFLEVMYSAREWVTQSGQVGAPKQYDRHRAY